MVVPHTNGSVPPVDEEVATEVEVEVVVEAEAVEAEVVEAEVLVALDVVWPVVAVVPVVTLVPAPPFPVDVLPVDALPPLPLSSPHAVSSPRLTTTGRTEAKVILMSPVCLRTLPFGKLDGARSPREQLLERLAWVETGKPSRDANITVSSTLVQSSYP